MLRLNLLATAFSIKSHRSLAEPGGARNRAADYFKRIIFRVSASKKAPMPKSEGHVS